MEGIRHAWRVLTFSDVPSSSSSSSREARRSSSTVSSSTTSLSSRRHPSRRIPLHRACSLPLQSPYHNSIHGIRSVRPGAYEVIRTRGPARPQRVVIPQDAIPGSTFTAYVGTQEIQAHCPANLRPGNSVRVMVPDGGQPTTRQVFLKMAALTKRHHHNYHHNHAQKQATVDPKGTKHRQSKPRKIKVRIPLDISPGSFFVATVNGTRYSITCPTKIPRNRLAKVKGIPLQETSSKWEETSLSFKTYMDPFEVAFVRRLVREQGKDKRLPTGSLSLVPTAKNDAEATPGSTTSSLNGKNVQREDASAAVVHAQSTTIDSETISLIQTKPLEGKLEWFHKVLSVNDNNTNARDSHLKLVIRRDHLLEDSIRAVMSLGPEHLRQPWKIEFVQEPGIDSGGVTREWFQLVSQQLFSPVDNDKNNDNDNPNGMWVCCPTNQMYLAINPDSAHACKGDHLVNFRFAGRLLGRALFDRQMVKGGHLVPFLYKYILGMPLSLRDLKEHDRTYFDSLCKLQEVDNLESLCLDFTVTENRAGVLKTAQLVEGGADKTVTESNLDEYYIALLHYRLLEQTKPQITELLLGFLDVIPEAPLAVFNPEELELTLFGLPTIDVDDWKAHTQYSGAFAASGKDHQLVVWFWEIVEEFDDETRARLLQFVTGSSGVSSSGFAALRGVDGAYKRFAVHGTEACPKSFPKAQTCFNRIDLPCYKTKEDLLLKLNTSLSFSLVGFGMD